jgi:hypothetical protein
MNLRSLLWPASWWRRVIVLLTALVGLYAVVGFLVLPLVLPGQITAAIRDTVARDATIGGMRINPFLLSVGIDAFAVADSDGSAMIEAGELFVDLDVIGSATQRAVVFDEVRLAAIRVNAAIDKSGRNNLAALAEGSGEEPAPEPTPAEAGSGMPPITIARLDLQDVRASFRDDAGEEPFEFELGPLTLQLTDLSTRPDSESPYSISATAPSGEELEWSGSLTIDPLRSSGALELSNVSLARIWRYVRGTLPLDLTVADADLGASYAIEQVGDEMQVKLSDGRVQLRKVGVSERGAEAPVLSLASLDVAGIAVDVLDETVHVGSITIDGGNVDVLLDEAGGLNLARLAPPEADAAPGEPEEEAPADAADDGAAGTAAASDEPAAGAWKVQLDKVDLGGFGVTVADNSVQPPFELRLDPVEVHVTGFSTLPESAFDLGATVGIAESGKLAVDLKTQLTPMSLSGSVDLSGLSLPMFTSYISKFANLAIPSGTAGASGTVALATGADGASNVRYDGSFEVADLAVRLPEAKEDLLRWQRLGLKEIALDTAGNSLAIGVVEIADPFAQVEIDETGAMTIDKVMIVAEEGAPAAAEPAAAAQTDETDAGPGMSVAVREVRLSGGTVQFVDHSVKPPFRTSLNDLQLSLAGFVLDDLGGIDIDLKAKIDEDAPLVIKGKLSPPGYREPADVQIAVTGYDLTAVTPYVGRYVGYEVDKGKLSLKLGYKLDRNTLVGTNDIIAQRFSLGEQIESPDATTLPVKMALAVLRDSDGKIALDVPVRGDVNDPKFSIGSTIAGTFSNLIQKIVTSPFSMLGSVAGMGGDKMSHIDFAPGSDELGETEAKKIEGLADVLAKRPGLQLEIRGAADTVADTPALADIVLAGKLEERARKERGGDETVEIDAETRQLLLFGLYEETFGRAIAAPADESVDERAERAESAVRQRLEVGPDDLARLGKERSRVIRDALEARGVPRAQLFRVKAKIVDKGRTPVRVQLTLSAAG